MRRTVALLALLATSWPPAVALECALGSAEGPPVEAGQHAPHGGDHAGMAHEHTSGSRASGDEGSPAGGRDCAMVMACGLAMIQAEGEAVGTLRLSAPEAHRFRSIQTPSATILVADPPPPRRNA